jgi:tetratricopeptide (TPR) repeat protein
VSLNRATLSLLLAGALAAAAGEVRADAVRASGSVRGDAGRLTLSWPAPVEFEARSVGDRHILRFARPVEADFAAALAPLHRFLEPPAIGEQGRSLSFPLKPGIVALTFADKTRVVIDLFAGFPPPVAAAQEHSAPATAGGLQGIIKPPVAAPNRVARKDAPVVSAAKQGATGAATPSLRFDWAEPVAAAAFVRAGALWLIFDKPSQQDIARLKTAAGPSVRGIEQRPHPRATVLRLDLAGDGAAGLGRDGLAWILDLGPRATEPSGSLEPMPRQDPDDAALVLPVAEPGAPLALSDPAVGDTLVVVPVLAPGHGLARGRDYPEFRLLSSLQGVVVHPLVDDLAVRPVREAVEVARPGGLALTPADAATLARAQLRSLPSGGRLLQLEPLAGQTTVAHLPTRQGLEAALAAAPSAAEREPLWLRHARLSLGHGLAAEALGALERAREARPALEGEPAFRALRGAATLLLGRLADADADLGHAALAGHSEASAWRTMLRVAQGRAGENSDTLDEQVAIAAGYPQVLRRALLPALAEAAIDAGKPALAERCVALLAAEATIPAEAAAVAFLEGRRLAANGDLPAALAKWREVEAGVDPERRSQVRAEYAAVDLGLAEKRIPPAKAIDALDALSFAWRGDGLELAVLRRLGELQLAEGDLAAALRTFKRAAASFPRAMQNDDIPATMTQAFAALFTGEASAKLSPLEAIALYDEFRELTPADARGDRVIEAVVERMVELDLLGRATSLLESQVRFRLTGAVRAAAGARLASLYLLDGKPEAALKAIEASAEADLPGVLGRDRQLIAARALVRLGRAKEALQGLKTSDTLEAAAVRADAYWRLGDWSAAASSLAHVLAAQGGANDGAGPEQRSDRVLHLAVALALAGDEAGLRRLAAAEGAAMAQSRWKDVFPLIAANTVPAADLQALAEDAGPVTRFRAYLAGADATKVQSSGSTAEPM